MLQKVSYFPENSDWQILANKSADLSIKYRLWRTSQPPTQCRTSKAAILSYYLILSHTISYYLILSHTIPYPLINSQKPPSILPPAGTLNDSDIAGESFRRDGGKICRNTLHRKSPADWRFFPTANWFL